MECRVTAQQVLPGVYHLSDRMGMHCTLLKGEHAALLFDTAYGLDDLKEAVARITDLPLTVICSHGHHDHACGNFQFDQVLMDEKEFPYCEKYAGSWRARVWGQAVAKGLDLSDWQERDFLNAGYGKMAPLDRECFDLGGMTARVVRMPGHTPGSIGLYLEELKCMLAGDNFNPTTWLFFDEAMPMAVHQQSLQIMLSYPFTHVLCSHGDDLAPREEMERFAAGVTKEHIAEAALPQPGLFPGTRVYGFSPAEGYWFCFDADKLPSDWHEALMARQPWPEENEKE